MSPSSTSTKLRPFLFAALSTLSTISAVVIPTAPGPGAVFNQGSKCSTSWVGDTEGKWNDMTIELMTGDNFRMIHLSTVGSGLDGNKDGTLDFTCPEVSPYSAIYFLQYSSSSSPGVLQWATRFTIADSNGNSVPPPETTQPDGANIPWGVGSLGGGGGTSGSSSSTGGNTDTSLIITSSTSTLASGASDSTTSSTSNPVTSTTSTAFATHSTTTSVVGTPITNVVGTGTGMTTVRNINTQATTGVGRATATLGVSGTGDGNGLGANNTNTQNSNHGSSLRFDSFEFAGVKGSLPVSFVTVCLFSVLGVFL
ncbi:hypothetical protein E1B28_008056 [Marasmius oreades]|uniref:Uncharacterized protein n=1 Tax=Marasmius oreades TaxID=181124 RepID=A0A9P7UUM6_9AGAR|nr:uncharacterized protein E1B28_008056 [Marasmius oreades]KAG7094460.1 hypothetical protein E1B28_008056 [Marasmius oreades]